ncbi:MAG: M15 family metallopeptidase [Fusobacteriaceae bacterium]|uniref:M15 family metallopeptidase n=1 Tax=Romboutsia sp. TaxID=1965302 RepID=UPI003F3259C3
MIDEISKKRIEQLHPFIKQDVEDIVQILNTTVLTRKAKVRIAWGLRTFAEQDELYKKVPKVTNAKGGDSVHNYGLAVDIVMIINGKEASWDTKKDWDEDSIADWDEVVYMFKEYGFTWGGDWKKFSDKPHFEKTNKLTLAQIKDKYTKKDFISGTKFIKI